MTYRFWILGLLILSAGPVLAQEQAGARLGVLLPAAAILAVAALVIAVYLFRQNGHRRAAIEKAEQKARSAEAARAELKAGIEQLTAEQRILRDKIDSLGRERDSYRRLVNAAPFAVWRRDASGGIIWRNSALEEILGPDAENDELASFADQDLPIQLVQRALESGDTAAEERRFVVDGQRRTYAVHETPTLADGGSAGYAIDISAIETVRNELKVQIEASNDAFEHLSSAVAIYARDRHLIYCNSAFRNLWGLDETFTNTEPSLGEVLDQLKDLRRLPEQVEYRQFRMSREALFTALLDPIEELYQRPDERMIRETVTRHGLGGLMFLFEDATDRIVMERSLNTYIAVQRATLDNLYEAVAVFGPDGRLNLSNTPYQNMFHLPQEMVERGPHVREMVDHVLEVTAQPPDLVSSRDALIASVTDPRSSRGRLEMPDGRVIDTASLTLPDAQKLFTYLDVTDSMQIERALRERNEALVAGDLLKSEFLENMSYELRTPLNAILGFGEILEEAYFGTLNDRQSEYVRGILEASDQLLSMINDMLDLASLQAGHMQLEWEDTGIADLVNGVLDGFSGMADRRRVALEAALPPADATWRFDPRRIRQVLSNLTSNAVKFTLPGGRVTLGATMLDEGLELWVQDNGIGIAEEEQDRVFETFRTSERHTRRGTGLGLALVRNLTELQGGEIELQSAIGQGTMVICRFYRSDGPGADEATPDAPIQAA